jgi:hypothetical protein
MFESFDILKKLPDGGIVWIEAAKNIETARERVKLFANYKPGEYVVFCHETQSLIATPWVSFSRHKAETRARTKTTTKRRAKARAKSPAKPKASEVVAKIVADIGQTFRHE